MSDERAREVALVNSFDRFLTAFAYTSVEFILDGLNEKVSGWEDDSKALDWYHGLCEECTSAPSYEGHTHWTPSSSPIIRKLCKEIYDEIRG